MNYWVIKKSTVNMIETQSTGNTYEYETSDLYAEDVQLISKDGKLYYLPLEQ